MKKLIIKREKKFASALMPYWVVTGMSRQDFIYKFQLQEDRYRLRDTGTRYQAGNTVTSVTIHELDTIGVKLTNGQTVETEIDDNVRTVFACTYDGWVTEEIMLDNYITADGSYEICLSTKGGLTDSSYPYFKKSK